MCLIALTGDAQLHVDAACQQSVDRCDQQIESLLFGKPADGTDNQSLGGDTQELLGMLAGSRASELPGIDPVFDEDAPFRRDAAFQAGLVQVAGDDDNELIVPQTVAIDGIVKGGAACVS